VSILTIRFPESKHERPRRLAESRGLSMNKLIDELATVALAQHDTEMRFWALAASGSVERGLELLDKLDHRFQRAPSKTSSGPRGNSLGPRYSKKGVRSGG